MLALLFFGVWLLVMLALFLGLFQHWLRCMLAGANVSFAELVAMRLRKSPLGKVTEAFIRIRANGIPVSLMEVEAEYIKDPRHFDLYVDILIEEKRKETGPADGGGSSGQL